MSGVSNGTAIERELRSICGDEHVSEYASRAQTDPEHPVLVVRPGTAAEAAAVLHFANANALSVIPEGRSSRVSPAAGIILETSRLVEVEHYDHADLTVGVGAGATVAQLSAMVAQDSLLFACDPPFPERATVGGVLAMASHGPLRHGYGALRDFCIGIRFVTGDGRRAKGGGRVVKNVAGYDLMKLLIGSYGTLAVITSASFKLFPAPRQTRTFLAEFPTAKDALEFRDRVMCSPLSPVCLELVSPGARKLMRPEMTSDAWVTCVRAAGSDAVLARYRKELGTAITRELDGEDESRLWRAIENFPVNEQAESIEVITDRLVTRIHIGVPVRNVSDVVTILEQAGASGDIGVAFVGRIGVGHILACAWAINLESFWPPAAVVASLRKYGENGVVVKVERGSQNPWPLAPPHLASMRAVKQALDPNNVLRGRAIF